MATNTTNNPYRAINEWQQQLQRFWNETAGTTNREEETSWYPVVDIYETEGELVLLSELPGLQEGDFKLSVDNSVLTLSGERKVQNGKQFKVHRQERPLGKFTRSFSLPANFDLGNVSANFAHGILKIKLPKKAEARPRQIPVKVK